MPDDATPEDAAKSFFEDNPEERPPASPELMFTATDFVEDVVNDDDYFMECAEFDIPKELEDQFEEAVRKTIRDFLTLHDLMPTHSVCENIEKFERGAV